MKQVPRPAKKLFYLTYASLYSLRNWQRPNQFIFIISHMRSGSTLLTHLLSSQPDICGYGETHIRYSSPMAFRILVGKVLYTLRGASLLGTETYVLDKVLHNRLIDPAHLNMFCDPRIKVIFLLREPRGTLASLIRTFNFTEARAVDYYLKRFAMLDEYASKLLQHASCAALTYDQLLQHTDEVFGVLERFLRLNSAISESYKKLPTTGRPKIGDPSATIQAGFIVRDKAGSVDIDISAEHIEMGMHAYGHCLSLLRCHCEMIE